MSTSHATDLRQQVHDELERLCSPDAALAIEGALNSARRYSYDGEGGRWIPDRLRLHAQLLDRYRQPLPGSLLGGRCAVVTAGPPAAGKTSAITAAVGTTAGWRRIDADTFKERLIEHALDTDPETYRDILRTALPDGGTVMPMELAGLFHVESNVLHRRALELCLRSGEDVVVEGTLQWPGLVDEYSVALQSSQHASLVVVDVQTPCSVALERAKSRWWSGRLRGGLGGRFTPARAIENLYDQSDGGSRCSINARRLVEVATSRGVEAKLETVVTQFNDVSPATPLRLGLSDAPRATLKSLRESTNARLTPDG